MTYPDDQPIPQLPDPPLPPGPRTTTTLAEREPYVITVPLRGCCGALPGDVCDCASWAAECLAAPQIPWPGKDDPQAPPPDWWS